MNSKIDMKKAFLLTLFVMSVLGTHASEYYALLVGFNDKGERIMRGTCRSYPLNTFLYVLESKKEKLTKYFPEKDLNYISFKTLEQEDNDNFYSQYKTLGKEEKQHLKNVETLRASLTKLMFVLVTKKDQLL